MGFQQIATHRPFWQPISTQATHALLFDLRQSKMVISWHPPVSIFWWLTPDICHWIRMYTGHEIYNLHIVLVLTCPFVLSAIYCEQVEKQVIEFSFSSILHTDTGLCQSSLVSPIKPIVHSKAPKPKVFAPPTLLVSKTPATRGAQELSNFTRVLLVVTRNYVWIMLPIVVSVTNPPAIILPHHKERPGTAISPCIKSNGPKSNSHAGPWMFEPHFVVTISNKSAVSFRTYYHLVELVHLDPHPAV